MTALEVWYEPHAATPAVVRTVEELDALVDRIIADAASDPIPAAAQVVVQDAPDGNLYLEVGLGPQRGVVTAIGPGGGLSKGDTSRHGTVTYDFAGHTAELPASAELPINEVRQALREYLTSGGELPQTVAFEPDEATAR